MYGVLNDWDTAPMGSHAPAVLVRCEDCRRICACFIECTCGAVCACDLAHRCHECTDNHNCEE